MILTELGYQAGQHELLADVLIKDIPEEIKLKVKYSQKQVENHRKDIKVLQMKLDKAYKDLDKSKRKYVKHHNEWHCSKEALRQAKSQINSTKPEVDKLQLASLNKEQQVDDYKGEYAQQLVKTNHDQAEYFHSDLPAVMDSLQGISENNLQFFKDIFSKCIQAEKEAAFIISKCHIEIENVIHDVSVDEDTNRVIEANKTGNIPPPDFQFEDLSAEIIPKGIEDPEKILHKEKDKNLYQKRREIEKKIKDHKIQIKKGDTYIYYIFLTVFFNLLLIY